MNLTNSTMQAQATRLSEILATVSHKASSFISGTFRLNSPLPAVHAGHMRICNLFQIFGKSETWNSAQQKGIKTQNRPQRIKNQC